MCGRWSTSSRWTAALTACSDRKSTRLNSSHVSISYAVFCLKKEKIWSRMLRPRPIGVDDCSFARGGASLLAIHVISLERRAGWHYTPPALFEHQTIGVLAKD